MKKWLVILTMSLAAPAALALTDGWDVDVEVTARAWRSSSLTWAKNLHPDHPSTSTLQAQVTPPPREMWCPAAGSWPQDCEAWDAHMDLWLHHYLDIPYTDPLPRDLPAFPKECPSSCIRF